MDGSEWSAFMLAQTADPGLGGAGWAGLAGSSLLASVLGWLLLKHLPAKDAQIEKLISDKDSQIKALITDKDKQIDLICNHHEEAVKSVVMHCQQEAAREREASERRHGEQMALLGNIRDATREAVHATRNLGHRERLANAVQSADVPVWTKGLDGTMTSWNAACERVLGWRQGEVVGRSVYDRIIPPDMHSEEEAVLRRIAAGETCNEYETVRRAKDGRRVPMFVVTSPIRDQSGKVIGASTIGREVDPHHG